MTAQLEDKLKSSLTGIKYLRVEDLSDGCGTKIRITCASSSFEGVSLLQRHRYVSSFLEGIL